MAKKIQKRLISFVLALMMCMVSMGGLIVQAAEGSDMVRILRDVSPKGSVTLVSGKALEIKALAVMQVPCSVSAFCTASPLPLPRSRAAFILRSSNNLYPTLTGVAFHVPCRHRCRKSQPYLGHSRQAHRRVQAAPVW